MPQELSVPKNTATPITLQNCEISLKRMFSKRFLIFFFTDTRQIFHTPWAATFLVIICTTKAQKNKIKPDLTYVFKKKDK